LESFSLTDWLMALLRQRVKSIVISVHPPTMALAVNIRRQSQLMHVYHVYLSIRWLIRGSYGNIDWNTCDTLYRLARSTGFCGWTWRFFITRFLAASVTDVNVEGVSFISRGCQVNSARGIERPQWSSPSMDKQPHISRTVHWFVDNASMDEVKPPRSPRWK
jgi:hypothetical protein